MRALIESDLVTPATRDVLRVRSDAPRVTSPRFFTHAEFMTLEAVCDRLIPQATRAVDIAGTLDTRMAEGTGDGWRYAVMPPDATMHRRGLIGIEQSAATLFGCGFGALAGFEQDVVLRGLQEGDAPGQAWKSMDAGRYFEEVLTQATDIYYAHPLTSEAIGYTGMADAHGWQAIGIDEREAHEPIAVS